MKLKEALATNDYSAFKKSNCTSFCNYYDTLAPSLYPSTNDISWEQYEAVDQSGRVAKYAIREWLCTDTHVGLYLYLIDEVPVCVSYQRGRKCDPEWHFLSVEAFNRTKQLFDEFSQDKKGSEFDIINADYLNLRVEPVLFEHKILNVQMGISPLHGSERLIETLILAPDKVMDFSEFLTDLYNYHNDFMEHLKIENIEDYQKAYDRSLDLYTKLDILIKLIKVDKD